MYCIRSFCNLGYADWVHFVKLKMEFLSFQVSGPRKNAAFFLYDQLLQLGAPLLGLAESIYNALYSILHTSHSQPTGIKLKNFPSEHLRLGVCL